MDFEKHCWVEIDLDALRSNFAYIQKTVGGDVCAVVKADAYGHGAAEVAEVLQKEGAAGFAVSNLNEGLYLRRHGITKPILILGYAAPDCAAVLAKNNIATACSSILPWRTATPPKAAPTPRNSTPCSPPCRSGCKRTVFPPARCIAPTPPRSSATPNGAAI